VETAFVDRVKDLVEPAPIVATDKKKKSKKKKNDNRDGNKEIIDIPGIEPEPTSSPRSFLSYF